MIRVDAPSMYLSRSRRTRARARARRRPRPRLVVAEDTRTRARGRRCASSTTIFAVEARRLGERGREPRGPRTLLMPTDEPRFAGLTKHGKPISRPTRSVSARWAAVPAEGRRRAGAPGKPASRNSALHGRLVHAERRGRARPHRRTAAPARADPARCRPRRTSRAAPGRRRCGSRRVHRSAASIAAVAAASIRASNTRLFKSSCISHHRATAESARHASAGAGGQARVSSVRA